MSFGLMSFGILSVGFKFEISGSSPTGSSWCSSTLKPAEEDGLKEYQWFLDLRHIFWYKIILQFILQKMRLICPVTFFPVSRSICLAVPFFQGKFYLARVSPHLQGSLTACLTGQLNWKMDYFPCENVHDCMHKKLDVRIEIFCRGELPFLPSNNIVVLVVNTWWTTTVWLQKDNLNP